VEDGVFFAEKGKLGEVDSSKISMLLGEMASRGIWDCSEPPLWRRRCCGRAQAPDLFTVSEGVER
jgi:hypothetical protein